VYYSHQHDERDQICRRCGSKVCIFTLTVQVNNIKYYYNSSRRLYTLGYIATNTLLIIKVISTFDLLPFQISQGYRSLGVAKSG
jgi:hypothetical protein